MVSRRERLEQRGGSRHAGCEQQRGVTAFERGQHRLGLIEGRILIARIGVACAVLVVRIAYERGRGMNGRRERARVVVHPSESLGSDAGGLHGSFFNAASGR